MTGVSVDAAANTPEPDQDHPALGTDEVTADRATEESVAEHSGTVTAPTVRNEPELTGDVITLAREAAILEAGRPDLVGTYRGVVAEDDVAVTAEFEALDPGYLGWHWSVTLALVEPGHPTISEVVLLPGTGALLAPPWVPWEQRIRPDDLGPGGLLPTAPDDLRLVPGYVESEDPAVEDLEHALGIGRVRVLSREGRDDAAQRWHDGPFGPEGTVAQMAPGQCVTCGFYVPLAGILGTALGVCANEFSPADGRVVDAAFGCGAHSEAQIDAPSISAFAPSPVDELVLEVHPRPVQVVATSDTPINLTEPIQFEHTPQAQDDEQAEIDVDWGNVPAPESAGEVPESGSAEADAPVTELHSEHSEHSDAPADRPLPSTDEY